MGRSEMPIFRRHPDLLRRFRDGERDALETVYRAYVGKIEDIARFGFRVPGTAIVAAGLARRPEELADLVQEVFVKAFAEKARRSFDGEREYGPFLNAITRNVAIDWARRRGREIPTPWHELDDARLDPVSEAETAPEAWTDEPTLAVVRGYLASLDGELRRLHEARYQRGLSQRDAAEALGIGRQVVRTLEARLREGLRQALAAAEKRP
jgi:RNA polymerase sigma-70 factor (ECF subfamily)